MKIDLPLSDVELVVFDMDLTILTVHTGGSFQGTPEDLQKIISPFFPKLLHKLLTSGFYVGIASFSDKSAKKPFDEGAFEAQKQQTLLQRRGQMESIGIQYLNGIPEELKDSKELFREFHQNLMTSIEQEVAAEFEKKREETMCLAGDELAREVLRQAQLMYERDHGEPFPEDAPSKIETCCFFPPKEQNRSKNRHIHAIQTRFFDHFDVWIDDSATFLVDDSRANVIAARQGGIRAYQIPEYGGLQFQDWQNAVQHLKAEQQRAQLPPIMYGPKGDAYVNTDSVMYDPSTGGAYVTAETTEEDHGYARFEDFTPVPVTR